MRSLDHLTSFEPRHEGSFIAYLIRTAHRLIQDSVRDARRRPVGEPLDEQVRDPGPTPDTHEHERQRADRIQRAMAMLSAKQRKLIELRFSFDLSYAEIAALLDTTPNAARMQLDRALAKLAQVVAKD